MIRPALFHSKVRETLRTFPEEIRRAFGKAILELQKGTKLMYPLSKPMPSVGRGIEELRLRDRAGAYRAFYLSRSEHGIRVFHAFVKKSQKTAKHEIETGRKRLKEMLDE